MHQALRAHFEAVGPISDAAFEQVVARLRPRRLRKHQFLIQPGQQPVHEYYVLSGCLKAFLTTDAGKDHILQFAVEDWWVSDYAAYFHRQAARLSVDCLDDCELLELTLADRTELCQQFHALEHHFHIRLANAVVAQQQRVLSTLADSVQQRYDDFVRRYPRLLQRVPKQLIAAYLGVSRETLSRLGARARQGGAGM